MRNIELTIVGFTNLNNFYDSLAVNKIVDVTKVIADCKHREEDRENNVYKVLYTIKN